MDKELKLIGEYLHRVIFERIMPPPTREGKEARRMYEQLTAPSEEERNDKILIKHFATAHHSGKYYIYQKNGVLIIPEDFSYTHFINNTWYEGDNFSFGNAI